MNESVRSRHSSTHSSQPAWCRHTGRFCVSTVSKRSASSLVSLSSVAKKSRPANEPVVPVEPYRAAYLYNHPAGLVYTAVEIEALKRKHDEYAASLHDIIYRLRDESARQERKLCELQLELSSSR